jgi:hypothetical protein
VARPPHVVISPLAAERTSEAAAQAFESLVPLFAELGQAWARAMQAIAPMLNELYGTMRAASLQVEQLDRPRIERSETERRQIER